VETATVGIGRERTPELRPFHELARVVADGPYSAVEVLERICAEVQSGFGFAGALVLRLRDGCAEPAVRQSLLWPDAPVSLDEVQPLRKALSSHHALVAGGRWPGGVDGPRVIVPLALEDRCIGFLVAGDDDADELDVDDETLALLTALGAVAAVFIDKADHYGALAGAFAELQHVDRVKTDFVGIASHELRTPIAVVHGIASTLHLRGDDLEEEQIRELRATLYAQTTRLAALTQSLLDLSRIESGALQVQPRRLRPRAKVLALLEEIDPSRLNDIRVEIADELEIVTDAEALERVVSNLVVNALKYGAPPVVIHAQAGAPFRLTVRDHGPGVDPELAEHVFDRFARGGRARGGAGLGLAIARSYAYALGGDLRYERAEPGARFELRLPA
jgi:signal transduction histidine kinase